MIGVRVFELIVMALVNIKIERNGSAPLLPPSSLGGLAILFCLLANHVVAGRAISQTGQRTRRFVRDVLIGTDFACPSAIRQLARDVIASAVCIFIDDDLFHPEFQSPVCAKLKSVEPID